MDNEYTQTDTTCLNHQFMSKAHMLLFLGFENFSLSMFIFVNVIKDDCDFKIPTKMYNSISAYF